MDEKEQKKKKSQRLYIRLLRQLRVKKREKKAGAFFCVFVAEGMNPRREIKNKAKNA